MSTNYNKESEKQSKQNRQSPNLLKNKNHIWLKRKGKEKQNNYHPHNLGYICIYIYIYIYIWKEYPGKKRKKK